MRRACSRLLLCVSLLAIAALAPACKGPDMAGYELAQGLEHGFNAIRQDAELGIRVRSTPALAAAAGVPAITPDMADFAIDTLDYHDALIERVKQRATGDFGAVPPPPDPPPGS